MNFNAANLAEISTVYDFYLARKIYWITFTLAELSTEWLLT